MIICYYEFLVKLKVNFFLAVGQEIREKLSGAVEALGRRKVSGSAPHRDHSKHRGQEDGPMSSKDVCRLACNLSFILQLILILSYDCSFRFMVQKRHVQHLEMAAYRRGWSCQVVVQAQLVNQVINCSTGQAGWCQAATAGHQMPKGLIILELN